MLIYTVKPGDTLAGISRRYGLSPLRIAADNGLSDMSRLVPGQNLLINVDSVRYILDEGQTLFSISQEYGVPLDELIKANPGLNPLNLRPGDTVMIPVARREKRRPILVNGYAYPSINTNSLNCVLPFLTFLSPFSYKLTPTAELVSPDDSDLIFRAQRSAVMPIMVVTNIFDKGFSTEVLSVILASEELQERLIGNILSELTGKNYYGVNMDIEYIAPDDRDRYNAFLERLAERLHNEGFIVMSALAPKISADQPGVLYEAHDYAEQGRIVDYVIIMTYEWGYTYGPPLAVSPINEVRRVLDYAVTEIPPEKILMGMPNYGYDWTLPFMRGTPAQSVSLTQAVDLALRYGVEIQFDEQAQTPYFYYTDNGTQHVVWFDDPRSIDAKLQLIDDYRLAGASWWTVNRCYVPNWLVLQNMYETVKL
ncbi:MAG: glycosyl hydrolase family 18 protein [Oscillospiraceae bacterium]